MPTRTSQDPTKNDAAFGRGGKLNRIRAESVFRKTIEALWEDYCDIPNTDYAAKRDYIKIHIILPILEQKGRFLYNYKQEWFELHPDDHKDCLEIVKRVQQALRDEKKRRSPSKDLTTFLHEVQNKKKKVVVNIKKKKKEEDGCALDKPALMTPPSLMQLATSMTKMPSLMPPMPCNNRRAVSVTHSSVNEISDNDSDCCCKPSPLWEMKADPSCSYSLDSFFYTTNNSSNTTNHNKTEHHNTADLIREFEAEWGLDDNKNDFLSSWCTDNTTNNVPAEGIVVSAQADMNGDYERHDYSSTSSIALPKDQLEGAFERRASITCVGPDVFWEQQEQQRRASMVSSCMGPEVFFV